MLQQKINKFHQNFIYDKPFYEVNYLVMCLIVQMQQLSQLNKVYIKQFMQDIKMFFSNKASTSQLQKQQQLIHSSLTNLIPASSRSNTKFVIRYEQKQYINPPIRPIQKVNRYSSKHEREIIRGARKISQSVLEHRRSKDGNSLPSYLRPTEASISAQLVRNRIGSTNDIQNQGKNGAIIRMRSKNREQDEEQFEKQYNRVPIQYYDEKNSGCGADSLRARVVFRGYAPKNTHLNVKLTVSIAFKRKPKKSILQPQSSCSLGEQSSQKNQISSIPSLILSKNDLDIRFQSKFESGNLAAASRISPYEYWLYMREDTNTHGLRQWFYFVATNRKQIKIKFRVYKFTKSYSLYRLGMKPYIRTVINEVLMDWQQGGDKVRYEYDEAQRSYYVQFEYKFQEENMEVEFAMLPVYTYSMMKEYIKGLQPIGREDQQDPISSTQSIEVIEQKEQYLSKQQYEKQQKSARRYSYHEPKQNNKMTKSLNIQISSLGQSLAGLDIPFIEITSPNPNNQQRQSIVVLARTHPGQTVSNFALESFIDTVLQQQQLTSFYDYFIVPMVNPDGVYFGNHRTSVIGQDLNRNFNTTDYQVFPEIEAVHNAVNKAKKNHKIRFLLDLHGHSARKNIFAYGDQFELNSSQDLLTRILPKLLSNEISSFKYNFCIFRQSKQKKNTARVYYTNRHKITGLTIQQSYGILEDDKIVGSMGVRVWKNFGVALARCLGQFAKIYKNGKQNALDNYLKDQTQRERILIEKRIQKQKKMLGITTNQPNNMISAPSGLLTTKMTKNKQSMKINKSSAQFHDTKNKSKINSQQNDEQGNIENNKDLIQQQQQIHSKDEQDNQQNDDNERSVALSQLSSGDQDLEMMNDEIEVIKKQIFKVGCMKQGIRREKYNIADKKLQLFDTDSGMYDRQASFKRVHEQKSSMIPRIAKLQLKRKEDYNMSFKNQFREERRDLMEQERIERRKEIEAKFRRMELPNIRK